MMNSVAPVSLIVQSKPAQESEKMPSKEDTPVMYSLCSPQMKAKLDPKTVKTIIISAPVLIAAINQALNGLFDIRDTVDTRGRKNPENIKLCVLEDVPNIDYAA